MTLQTFFVPNRMPHVDDSPFGALFDKNKYGVDPLYLSSPSTYFMNLGAKWDEHASQGYRNFVFSRPIGGIEGCAVPSTCCGVPEFYNQTMLLVEFIKLQVSKKRRVSVFVSARIGQGIETSHETDSDPSGRLPIRLTRDDHARHWQINIMPLLKAGAGLNFDVASMDVSAMVELCDMGRSMGHDFKGEAIAAIQTSTGYKPHAACQRMPWYTHGEYFDKVLDPLYQWKFHPGKSEVGIQIHDRDRFDAVENPSGWTLDKLRRRHSQGIIVHAGGGLRPDEFKFIIDLAKSPPVPVDEVPTPEN